MATPLSPFPPGWWDASQQTINNDLCVDHDPATGQYRTMTRLEYDRLQIAKQSQLEQLKALAEIANKQSPPPTFATYEQPTNKPQPGPNPVLLLLGEDE